GGLGPAAVFHGPLNHARKRTVIFVVAAGATALPFAAVFIPSPFSTRALHSFPTRRSSDLSASATVSLAAVPTIASLSPTSGTPEAGITHAGTPTNWQAGATSSVGAGVTVSSTTVVSSTQLSVAIAIASSAAMGPLDVTDTN